MKRNLLLLIAIFIFSLSFGQGEIDAYRFSSNDLSGTARGQAMGGAFGALGGDVTGVAINPAGLGIYRSSEVVANMSITSPLITGNTIQKSNTKFSLDNISYVYYYPLVKGGMLSLNFGFNYNRIKSFNQTYRASTQQMKSSLTDYMVLLTNGIHKTTFDNKPYDYSNAPWLSILAWDGYLIDPIDGKSDQYKSILEENERVSPSLKVNEKGKVESYDFTIGSNIANIFYWGTTFSITDLSYSMTSNYDESFLGDKGGGFNLGNFLETKGSGFQFKLGVILKPVDVLRIGLAYHSPVWYSMTDYFDASIKPRGIYNDDGGLAGLTETPYDAYTNYHLQTPGSWTVSLATVLGSKAILSVDYENKNYSSMNLKDKDKNNLKNVNDIINDDYKNTSTIRAGLEFRFTPQFSGRVGYAWAQNPYKDNITSTGKIIETAGTIPHYMLSNCTNYFTAGAGFRFTPQFYMDLAFVLRMQNDDLYYFQPVGEGDSYQGNLTNKALKGLVTLGYKF